MTRLLCIILALAALSGCRDATFGIGGDFGNSNASITTGATGTSGNVTVGVSG